MTRYYVYFPYRFAKTYSVIVATGLEVARMERFCRSLPPGGGQAAYRIFLSEARMHLRGSRIASQQSGNTVGAASMENAADFLAAHPLPQNARDVISL